MNKIVGPYMFDWTPIGVAKSGLKLCTTSLQSFGYPKHLPAFLRCPTAPALF